MKKLSLFLIIVLLLPTIYSCKKAKSTNIDFDSPESAENTVCSTEISQNTTDEDYQEDSSEESASEQVEETAATVTRQSQAERDADGKFTVAIIPDTQYEVIEDELLEKETFLQRCRWLADKIDELDIRLAIHTGDITFWGQRSDLQFPLASEGFDLLKDGGMMLSLCIGNHDTDATFRKTTEKLRETDGFNSNFGPEYYESIFTFEENKTDNAYQLFTACGRKFMIMNLEMYPRTEVLDWVENVVKDFPDTNIFIATHSYLNSKGNILSDIEFGDNSPSVLFDRIVSKYENIKFVFSGHTGNAKQREDIGVNGNKTVSFLGGFHAAENLVQLLEIDVNNGSASINTYYPYEDCVYGNYGYTVDKIVFNEPIK